MIEAAITNFIGLLVVACIFEALSRKGWLSSRGWKALAFYALASCLFLSGSVILAVVSSLVP